MVTTFLPAEDMFVCFFLDLNEAILSKGVHRVFSKAGIAGIDSGDEQARTDKSISGELPEMYATTMSSTVSDLQSIILALIVFKSHFR